MNEKIKVVVTRKHVNTELISEPPKAKSKSKSRTTAQKEWFEKYRTAKGGIDLSSFKVIHECVMKPFGKPYYYQIIKCENCNERHNERIGGDDFDVVKNGEKPQSVGFWWKGGLPPPPPLNPFQMATVKTQISCNIYL
jgi:hypothetical protein